MEQRNKMTTCGHCNVGHHECCPSGVRNGNGEIHPCGCTKDGCRAGLRRCTDCNNWTQEEVGSDWRCIDRNDCLAEQERKLAANPSIQWIRKWRTEQTATRQALRATHTPTEALAPRATTTRSSVARSVAPRECTCGCEGKTKGGKFLPGHDSKYLNQLVESAARGGRHADEALVLAGQISEAFTGKLRKRAGL